MRLQTIALLSTLALSTTTASAQKAVFLARHAEKADASKDPALSPAGQARAQDLAKRLAGAGVTAIVTSEYKRTAETAAPLARILGIESAVVSAKEPDALVARLREKHAADVVLVVGHSNSVPELVAKLGGPALTIGDDEYDNLFLLVPAKEGPPAFSRVRYSVTPRTLGNGSAASILFDAASGSPEAGITLLTFPPGASVPEHTHESAEVLYVLEGEAEMTLAGQPLRLAQGAAIRIPAGTKHSARVRGDQPVRAVQVYTPAGPEQRFKNPPPEPVK